jgi:hypothetical protein
MNIVDTQFGELHARNLDEIELVRARTRNVRLR